MSSDRDKNQIRMDIIDLHAHWYPEGCFHEIVRNQPDFNFVELPAGGHQLTWRRSHVMSAPPQQDDMRDRLSRMDLAGVAVQVLSIGALDICWAGSRAAAESRRINDALAEVCRQSTGRFRFVAALPLEERGKMIRELDRALSLGAIGVGITTTVGGNPLDAPVLSHFWRSAADRNLLVLVHPTYPPHGPSGDLGQFLTAGYLGETALAATRLVLAGVLEECRGVRLVWSHLGGTLPMMIDRLDRSYKRYERCLRPPSAYLRECFFDTACCHGPALDCARATFGAGALVFGTDEPHGANASRDVLAALRSRDWPAAEVDGMLSGNARRLGLF